MSKMQHLNIKNSKAYHDYFIEETLECGISLRGNEVKSILNGKVSIKEAWVTVQNNQLVIRGMHITAWDTSNKFDVDELRERVLLAHKKEIYKLDSKSSEPGYTLVPLKIYTNNHHVKVLIGVCKGKQLHDKRQTMREQQAKRDIAKAFKSKNKEV